MNMIQKLNLSIAEGDLPDVFHVNESQLQQLVDADLIWDLTDIYETYASDAVKSYISSDPDCLEAGQRKRQALWNSANALWSIRTA